MTAPPGRGRVSAAGVRRSPPSNLFEDAPVGLFTVDRRLVVRRANGQARRMLGVHQRSAAVGRRLLDRLDDDAGRQLLSALSSLRPAGDLSVGEVRWRCDQGDARVVRVEARARPRGNDVLLAFIDVTEARAEADSAQHRARHDGLTGLLNRTAVLALLEEALQTARGREERLAVVFVDLDHFKTLNDTLGHEAGDKLLCEVAQRLNGALDGRVVAARLGGDEFLALLPGLRPDDDAQDLAGQLLSRLCEPLDISGHEVRPAASMGVSLFPQDAEDGRHLLRRADLALYCAKREGRGAVRCYQAGMDPGDGLPGLKGF